MCLFISKSLALGTPGGSQNDTDDDAEIAEVDALLAEAKKLGIKLAPVADPAPVVG